ncbi:MAG: DUF2459 domain-containing protein, partial [Calditrichaeota bacterium]
CWWGCTGQRSSLFPPSPEEPTVPVYVVGHGWHTGIVLPVAEVSDTLLPGITDFADETYVEFGWGDEAFYRAEEPNVWLALRAVFWPTPSVLHVVGFSQEVPRYFPASEIFRIDLSWKGFYRLCRFIDRSYARNAAGELIHRGKGLYGNSGFYAGREKYYGLRTCNSWVARALREAGCPIKPTGACTAEDVLVQVKRFGKKVHSPSVSAVPVYFPGYGKRDTGYGTVSSPRWGGAPRSTGSSPDPESL